MRTISTVNPKIAGEEVSKFWTSDREAVLESGLCSGAARFVAETMHQVKCFK